MPILTTDGLAVSLHRVVEMADDAFELRNVPMLGNTLVAKRPIAPGELLFRESAHLVASSLRQLPPALQVAYQQGAKDLGLHLDDLLIAHAAARCPEAVRACALAEFCSIEVCEPDHPAIGCARATTRWCAENDPEWARLGMETADCERLLVAFALNAFGCARRAGFDSGAHVPPRPFFALRCWPPPTAQRMP